MNKTKKFILLVVAVVFGALAITGCGCSKKDTTFTVTFDSKGGTSVKDVTVKKGEKVKRPDDPTKSGYTFDGWYLDLSDKKEFNFKTKINKDITLKAKWSIKALSEENVSTNTNSNVSTVVSEVKDLKTEVQNKPVVKEPEKNIVDVNNYVNESINTITTNNAYAINFNASNNNIELNVLNKDASIATTSGTGLVAAIRKLIRKDDIKSVTLTSGSFSVVLDNDGWADASGTISIVAKDLSTFMNNIGAVKQGDFLNKNITLTVMLEENYITADNANQVAYPVVVKLISDVDSYVSSAVSKITDNTAYSMSFDSTNKDINALIKDTTASIATTSGTGLVSSIRELIRKDDVKSVTISVDGNEIVLDNDGWTDASETVSIVAKDLLVFFNTAGITKQFDLVGKDIKYTVTLEDNYYTPSNETSAEYTINVTSKIEENISNSVNDVIESFPSNEIYQITTNDNEIEITILDEDANIAATSGTGLVSKIRKLLKEDNNIDSIKIVCGDKNVLFDDAGWVDGDESKGSIVAKDLITFFTEISATTEGDLIGKTMTITLFADDSLTTAESTMTIK